MFYVYILYSTEFDKYYIGQTIDVLARLERHNHGSEKATSPYIPWALHWFTQKESRAEAMILEKKLKNLSKKRLREFIQKYGSAGPDVADGKSGC